MFGKKNKNQYHNYIIVSEKETEEIGINQFLHCGTILKNSS